MHPYFSTPVQPWQSFNPIDIGMQQRQYPWFDPIAFQAAHRGAFPGMNQVGFPGIGISEHLSPENFISSFGKTPGNYLSPEFLEFLRAELLRSGKALRTLAPALEHDNREVKEQAHLAATAQFFYALGLLYTRGLIIPPEVPGTSSRAEEPSVATACEVFGEALERFARDQFQGRGNGRDLGELSQKARLCFHALAPDTEQLERVRDERMRVDRKKAVSA